MYCICHPQIRQEGIELSTDVRVSFMPLVDTEGLFIMRIGGKTLVTRGEFKANVRYGLYQALPNILHPTQFVNIPTVSIRLGSPTIEVRARFREIEPQVYTVNTTREKGGIIQVLDAVQIRYNGNNLEVVKRYR